MITIVAKGGQMCNQLITLAAAYALGLEYKQDVRCPVMDENLKRVYAFKQEDGQGISVSMYNSKIWHAVSCITKCAAKFGLINTKKQYDPNKKNQFFYDWISFRDDKVIARHQEEIRSFFRFSEIVYQGAEKNMEAVLKTGRTTVGVHMRRGDYREYKGGQYYYTDSEYLSWMKSLYREKDVVFVLFSNEKIDESVFEKELEIFVPNGSAVQDLCSMSMCDYIMGPPSTYSWWAAMYGGKKRLILRERTAHYTWSDFLTFEERVFVENEEF